MSTYPSIQPEEGDEIECDLIQNLQYAGLKSRLETILRIGVEGVGAADLGRNDSGWSFTAVKHGLRDDIEAWAEALEDLIGYGITLRFLWQGEERTMENLFVVQVSPRTIRAVLVPGDRTVDTRGEMNLTGFVKAESK